MIEQMMSTLKSEVGEKLLSQANLPTNQVDKVFSIIGDVTKTEVANQMLGGGLSNVMNLFSSKPNGQGANLLQSSITTGVVSNLVSKLGLSQDISQKVAQIAIPALIKLITKKNSETPDNDASPLNDLFGIKSKGGLGNVAKGLLGKFLK